MNIEELHENKSDVYNLNYLLRKPYIIIYIIKYIYILLFYWLCNNKTKENKNEIKE